MSLGFPLAGMASQLYLGGPVFQLVFNIVQLTLKGLSFMIPFALDRLLYKRLKDFAGTLGNGLYDFLVSLGNQLALGKRL